MFFTLNQALKESPVGMAIVELPRKQIVKLNPDGSYRVMLSDAKGVWGHRKDPVDLDQVNRKLVLLNINCRPVYE